MRHNLNNLRKFEYGKTGFKFVGSTIIYSFMQAVGMVNDHLKPCFVYEGMKSNGLLG